MASSSYSDFSREEPHQQYDVFISFRGRDTRKGFTSHLYEALKKKFVTFIDDKIRSGDEISSLFDTIKKSKAAVVIFSENYASSDWCLRELVEILKCKNEQRQIVIPVFYDVNPTDVEKQTGSYAKAFADHVTDGIPVETLQEWKKALTEASGLKGYDTAKYRDEASLTKQIVDDIWKELPLTCNDKIDDKNLIGIKPKVEQVESLLNMGSGDVCYVGIWGIGGIGKTTLANSVFNKIRNHFEGSCFLRNIREQSEKDVERLRQRLYFDISDEENGNIVDDRMLNRLLSRKKVLIVFDDVTNFKQIKSITGSVNSFNRESRFIITSRDEQVLKLFTCTEEKIYKVTELCDQEARKLLSRIAFNQEHPPEDWIELSSEIVNYAKGSPLALEILGAALFGLRKEDWDSAIAGLKGAPNQEIHNVLKVSYDGLNPEEKNLFLDIACFFKGEHKKDVLNLYVTDMKSKLRVLISRCLVSADSYDRITMHDLLQETGLQIVREESEYPDKRSRLWDYDDIYEVLTRTGGTRAIKGISLHIPPKKTIHLNKNSFANMSELWFLNINSSSSEEDLCCSEDFQCASTKLRFLCWFGYPLKSLRSSFSLENLVILEMRFSKVEQLWDGEQPPPNLKEIDLSDCQNLTTIPDLSLMPKLEKISLSSCDNLTSLPPCDLPNLKEINLSSCQNLTTIPDLSLMPKLERISLSGCDNLTSLPPCNLLNLKQIDFSGCQNLTTTSLLPCDLPNLKQIDLSCCQNLTTIPELSLVPKLEEIHLRDCGNLTAIPDLSLALELLVINLSGCSNLTSLPSCDHLEYLDELDLSHCKKLVTIPELSCNISRINLSETGIRHLPSSIGNQWLLFSLDLSHCHELRFLPKEISNLKYIRYLFLSYCQELQCLPDELPRSLKCLDARGCSSLNVVPYSLSILLATTQEVFFSGCYMLDKEKFRDIIQGALLGIQQLRFRERPAQAIKEDGKVSVVAYSGCEIPKIFEFQHLGSMISMKLPYEMVGGELVGLAFFFVYKPCERDEELGVEDEELEVQDTRLLSIKFHCKTTFENSECSLIRDKFKIRFSESVSKAAEDDSTVVVVGYTNPSYHRTFPSHYQSILLELEFSLSCCEVALELAQLGWCSLPCCEVKRCGFKLFSRPLSEEGKGTSSSSSEEKQLERSPKRHKIS